MNKQLFLFLCLLVALATNSLAQNNTPKSVSGPNVSVRMSEFESGLTKFLESDDEITSEPGRPRIVAVKADAGVKSSVMVKIASVEHSVFDLINQKRAENGLRPVAWSDELERIARGHSEDMAQFDYFSHRSLDGKSVSDRADDAHLGKWQSIGENIAFNRGYNDPLEKAVDLWMNSPAHKTNLMSDNWKESAVGVAIAPDGSYYFTQVFLKRK